LHRSLQIQVLSWLAALATLGAATKPTFDTILFATAFVFGTLLMHVRERMENVENKIPVAPKLRGRALGAMFAWGIVAIRHFTTIHFPVRLSVSMLIAAAVIPTGIFVVEAALSLFAKRRAPARDEA
jgi:hypothetical protein